MALALGRGVARPHQFFLIYGSANGSCRPSCPTPRILLEK